MSSPSQAQPGVLERIGASCARHPIRVVVVWLVLLVGLVLTNRAVGGTFSDNVSLPGTQANTGAQLLTANSPAAAGSSGTVVFHVPAGSLATHRAAIESVVTATKQLPHVLSASNPFDPATPTVSPDGRTAYSTVHFDVRPKTLDSGYLDKLNQATAAARDAGVQVEYGGSLDELTRPAPADRRAEGIGLLVALLVLLVGFGSVLGALLPLLTALIGTLIGVSILGLVAAVLTFGTAAPTLALMIGIGVGIDYALFLTTRFRQQIIDEVDPVTAAGRTVATSGHAVLVAAATVAVAMLGLYASGITFIGQLGLAAVFTVTVSAAAAITLVPAGLGLLGRRIDRFKVRTPVAEKGSATDFWHRYARYVTRRPWRFFTAGILLLAVLSIPLFSMRLGHVDDGADPTSFTDKRAYDLISAGFGPGANGPFTVVVDLSGASEPPSGIATSLHKELAGTPGVARTGTPQLSANRAILVTTVVPTTGPQDAATSELFTTLIDHALPTALAGTGTTGYVTGTTAGQLQFQDSISARLPIIIAVVVLTAFILILGSFGSPFLAVKAAVLNLLSIGAAYGVVVAVFQWGWGRSLIGVSENVPIESYVPMMMFAIVFGLSMDYEVFLLSKVKEEFDRTRDNTGSVRTGLAVTGRVITCAALIMISVFSSFAASPEVVIKMLAIGLATSVLIDASIVRLLLVPATMTLFPTATWWTPGWLTRLLPYLKPGRPSVEPATESAADTGPDATPEPSRL